MWKTLTDPKLTAAIAAALALLAATNGQAQTLPDSARPANPQAATWPQWRGPHRDGSVNPATWPARLDPDTLQQQWRVELAPSYSGPIVSEQLVFTTETRDETTEFVRAFDRKSGAPQWEVSWQGALSVPFFAKANGDWIRSTPALDGERLYVAGMRDVLVCLNAHSGEILWRFDFVAELAAPIPEFGCVCSPLVDGDFVYLQAGAGFCKLDKLSGKLIWRTLVDAGGMMGSAFSSPIMADVGGVRQLLVQTREALAGVDPESGDVLWSVKIPAFRGMNILTPTLWQDHVFTSAYNDKSYLFRIPAASAKPNEVSALWENRARGYMGSPVVVADHAYLHLQNQRLICLDLKTGETRWSSPPFGKYWSMVTNGSQILALDEGGELLLIAVDPHAFQILDRRKISDAPTWAHLAICGDEIFVRELRGLAAYRWQKE